MNDAELIEAWPEPDRRAVKPAAIPDDRLPDILNYLLCFVVAATGIVLGGIFALVVALFSGLISISC